MRRKYPYDYIDMPYSDLHTLQDARIAWDILYDVAEMLKAISRACGQ